MNPQKYITAIIAFLILLDLLSGCSRGHFPGNSPVVPELASETATSIPDFPEPYLQPAWDDGIRTTESFNLGFNASTAQKLQIISDSNGILIKNPGAILYDVRIILDRIEPSNAQITGLDNLPNNRLGLDFGIIPAGKISTPRIVSIPPDATSIKAHIEYRTRAYVENDSLRIHALLSSTNVIPGRTTKAIIGDSIILGCESGLSGLYPVLREHSLFLTGLIEPLNLYEARFYDNRNPYDVIEILKSNPAVNHAEIESVVFPAYFPNDPIYDPVQPDEPRWAFERINAIKAWDFYSDGQVNQTGDAKVKNIVFAILDTGLTLHQDLALDSFDLNLINTYGKNFVTPGSPVLDTDGHGTAVAGIMGAMGNNGIGMSGMAWNPYFLPIKVFTESKEFGQVGPLYRLLQGLMYVRDLAGRAPFFKFVVNMSLGGYEQTPSYWTTEAINQVSQRSNVILIAGCGNDKNDKTFAGLPVDISADNYYPAALDKVISVGASSSLQNAGKDREVFDEDSVHWGTNWGTTVDLCAPGSLSIYTISRTGSNAYIQNFGGTSASCAFVSGLSALIWSKNPSWTRDQVKTALINCCDPMFLPAEKIGKLGAGRIDAYRVFSGIKPVAVINNVYWMRSGNPIFGDAIHVSGDGIFADDSYKPDANAKYNFRWYLNGDYRYPVAYGREAMILKLKQGHYTIQLKVWNKGQEWNFSDSRQFSDPVEWPGGFTIDDSPLPDDYFDLIYIPAGNFTMGTGPGNAGYGSSGYEDEIPQHSHFVDGFYIRHYEVTTLEFQNFMESGGYTNQDFWLPDGWTAKQANGWEHPLNWLTGVDKGGNPIDFPETAANPVNGISWWEADAFCRWAHMQLPSEAQWEKAARGSGDPLNYPWGMDWIVNNSNCDTDTVTPVATAVVGTYSPQGDSPYGLADCAGNVWEWCQEWYDPTIYNQYATGDYTPPATGTVKCCRGGGWWYEGSWVSRCSSRYSPGTPSQTRNNETGFRPIYFGD